MKYKERFARWNKKFFAQYDIVDMMNLKDFEFRDFIISVTQKSITHKEMNSWSFVQDFESKELISEFMFWYYQHNFYPRGGWMNEFRNNDLQFTAIKKRLEAALEARVKPK